MSDHAGPAPTGWNVVTDILNKCWDLGRERDALATRLAALEPLVEAVRLYHEAKDAFRACDSMEDFYQLNDEAMSRLHALDAAYRAYAARQQEGSRE